MVNRLVRAALALLCAAYLLGGVCAAADMPLAPREQDLSPDEAIAIAYAYLRANSGLTEAEMAGFACVVCDLWPYPLESDGSGERYYTVVLQTDQGTVFQLALDIHAGDSSILNESVTDIAESYRQQIAHEHEYPLAQAALQAWEAEKGPMDTWTHQERADFSAQFPATFGGFAMPGPDDLTEADALALARAALMRATYTEDAYLSGLDVYASFQKSIFAYEEGTGALVEGPGWAFHYGLRDGPLDLHSVHVLSPSGLTHCGVFGGDGGILDERVLRRPLYWNPLGGKYFHHDDHCALADSRYHPLTEIPTSDYANGALDRLRPCPECLVIE